MVKVLGHVKTIFYFDTCGQVNTEKTLELAIKRGLELKIKEMVVASETGLSALEAAKMLKDSGIDLIVVTSAAGTEIKNTVIGNLKIGISDKNIWSQLNKAGARIVRATDPLHNIDAVLEEKGIPTIAMLMRRSLGMVSSGTAVCVGATLMATDSGLLKKGQEVVAVAGSWVGLDTAIVVTAANSVDMLKDQAPRIREIICKPRNPTHSWPVNQKDWVGNLKPYSEFAG
jgi:hypothetical protein